jgi:hypothetical protein
VGASSGSHQGMVPPTATVVDGGGAVVVGSSFDLAGLDARWGLNWSSGLIRSQGMTQNMRRTRTLVLTCGRWEDVFLLQLQPTTGSCSFRARRRTSTNETRDQVEALNGQRRQAVMKLKDRPPPPPPHLPSLCDPKPGKGRKISSSRKISAPVGRGGGGVGGGCCLQGDEILLDRASG